MSELGYAVTDHIATVTLNRPEAMNALTRSLYAELEEAFRQAHRDPQVRCVILTGAGRAFCSGDDVKQIMLGEQRDATLTRLRDVRPRPTAAAVAVLECDKPVIAAVNGPAVGWGMDLALFCDIRIASDRAKFGELFIKRGLVSDIGGLWRLPRLVGPSKAAELLFTGEVTEAPEAESRFRALPQADDVSRVDSHFTIRGRGDGFVTDVIQCLAEHQIRVSDFRTVLPTLEDVFLKLTGHSIRD